MSIDRKVFYRRLLLLTMLVVPSTLAYGQISRDSEQRIMASINSAAADYYNLAETIWGYAELGYSEHKSALLLTDKLQRAGFSIETGVAGMPTGFIASYGEGGPTIALLAEYDALPGFSQTTDSVKTPHSGMNNGHACGHHLIGTASVAAAISVMQWMKHTGTAGTIKVYGTPAEEGGSGKTYMARDGLFDAVDIALHWHPYDSTYATPETTLARIALKFNFTGQPAHASNAPHQGRSALDGLEAMNHMVNLMREHMRLDSRIHYVITQGGDSPNVVPAAAESYYYIRSTTIKELRDLTERVKGAAEGAAMGTGTAVSWSVVSGTYNILPNIGLQRLMHKYLVEANDIAYTPEEITFIRELSKTLADVNKPSLVNTTVDINDFSETIGLKNASTDVGDVSWVVPTGGVWIKTFPQGTSLHSWQAVASGGTTVAYKGMLLAAKAMAMSAADLLSHPHQVDAINQEWRQRKEQAGAYKPLINAGPPPLGYWGQGKE